MFLHGFMGSATDWRHIIAELSAEFYCIAVDLPGHGLSEIDELKNSYSIENTGRYIGEYLKNKKIGKCDLLGYSMGGRIAIYLAIHYPEYFNKIIIESAQPGIKDETERQKRIAHDEKLAKKLLSEPFKEFLKFWYDQSIFNTLKKHKDFTNMLQSRLNNNPHKLAKSLKEIGAGTQISLWNDLIKIKIPCLLITGEFDVKYQKLFSKMHKEILFSNFVILRNSGHNSHFENPGEFIKVIKKFLKN